MTDAPLGHRIFLNHIRDIRTGRDDSVEIIALDQFGAEVVIHVGPEDLKLIEKALANRDWRGR